CGSLDCHGAKQRNFQTWGSESQRLASTDYAGGRDPNNVGGGDGGTQTDTTPAELDATYRSIVGLEPAVMSAVIESKGREPNMLTFVRKARGTESHKGGKLISPGDDQDKCIASWLKNAVDNDSCTNALSTF